MELWIVLIVIAQFISAVVVLIDKYIVVSPHTPNPTVYAFYILMLSGVGVLALPFGVHIPSLFVLGYAILSALCFLGALLALYLALRKADASDIVPVVSALAALSAFIFGYFLLDAVLPKHFVIGFMLLVSGMFILSRFHFNIKTLGLLAIAGTLFGLSSVYIKLIFVEETFINGFFWSRMANVVVAPLLFLIPGTLSKVFFKKRKKGDVRRFGGLILLSKTLGGFGFLFVLGATYLGDVALVNALAALQFVFLLIFALLFNSYFPDYFNEGKNRKVHILINKIIGVSVVVAGFFMLFL